MVNRRMKFVYESWISRPFFPFPIESGRNLEKGKEELNQDDRKCGAKLFKQREPQTNREEYTQLSEKSSLTEAQ